MGKAKHLVLFGAIALIFFSGDIRAKEGASDVIFELRAALEAQEERIAVLEKELKGLKSDSVLNLGSYVRLEQGEIHGVKGPHVLFEGVNLHVRSGSGFTNDMHPRESPTNRKRLVGLGNLIIGYNELPYHGFTLEPGDRAGSHNLVLGSGNRYRNFGGIVHGWENTVEGTHSAVITGDTNYAKADYTGVVGGWNNKAKGMTSVILGGMNNETAAPEAVVAGGMSNKAAGRLAVVSGGGENTAAGELSSVSGGFRNKAAARISSISGGSENTAEKEGEWKADVRLND